VLLTRRFDPWRARACENALPQRYNGQPFWHASRKCVLRERLAGSPEEATCCLLQGNPKTPSEAAGPNDLIVPRADRDDLPTVSRKGVRSSSRCW